ncbi:pirin family protein [Herbaspirillum sp. RTI4]|uniref:pirin family protein n=1 Tax=Herbaspirillum sp. RTI4 TaxID=3048640 RepID=UPI002AB5BF60|nr:pirin family protein [Herbaspirillum sp. RTI4]MDY7580025.1 pirin family protein [Herbaspirillum sp. RTI4]MEA9982838.1 pirin family protein [Herbaspirillum sp. RTI4]
MLQIHQSKARGYAEHGWLRSYHSFSFADYYDPQNMGFGPLRVINEDWIEAGKGFGTHGHRDMEIITYVLEGELAHKDSMGNGSVIKPGDVQRMSAGSGVQHSEYNHSAENPAHLLQIWIMPDVAGIVPEYEETSFPAAEKDGCLRAIAAPDGRDGAVKIHQNAVLYAGLFDGAQQAQLTLDPARLAYVHVVRGTLVVNGHTLTTGDAAKLSQETEVRLTGGVAAEVLVFDLPS